MFEVMFDGHHLTGSAEEIIQFMWERHFDHEQFKDLDTYMKWLEQSVWRFSAKGVKAEGDTTRDRAESLLVQLAEIGLVKTIRFKE